MELGQYPPGAEYDSNAPYNQSEQLEEEIEVTITLTLSKTVKVKVTDYTIDVEAEDDGSLHQTYDFSSCNLRDAVENQIVLPHNLAAFTEAIFKHDIDLRAAGMPRYLKEGIKDCKGWNVEDYDVTLD